MEFARFIMSEAALQQQRRVCFGGLPNGETTLVEADESSFGHFDVEEEG